MIKILIVLPTLGIGGAERVLSFLYNNLNKEKFETQLLIVGKKDSITYNIVEESSFFLNKRRVLNGVPSIISFIRNNKPDIVFSSVGHLNTVMGLIAPFFPKTKFVIREASVISAIAKYGKTNFLRDFLSKVAFKQADKIICQSMDMALDFQKLYTIPKNKIEIINNPITIDIPNKFEKKKESLPTNYITIGRLSKEKGHERILKILSRLTTNFKYTIIGSGPEKDTIFSQIRELGLDSKVSYIDHTNNVAGFLMRNDFFLQGSYVEGFPNALLESCAVGIPVIAFDVPGGTKEIVEHGFNGFLVENEDEYLDCLSTNKIWNSCTIRENIQNKFSKTTILDKYETMFKNVLQ